VVADAVVVTASVEIMDAILSQTDALFISLPLVLISGLGVIVPLWLFFYNMKVATGGNCDKGLDKCQHKCCFYVAGKVVYTPQSGGMLFR
jgi:hypothetical protein